jgi:hypothetical protein
VWNLGRKKNSQQIAFALNMCIKGILFHGYPVSKRNRFFLSKVITEKTMKPCVCNEVTKRLEK